MEVVMTDDLRLLAMESAFTEGRIADSRWLENETLVVAILEGGRPRIFSFARDELISWQRRAWEYGGDHPWAEFEECVAATYERSSEILELEAVNRWAAANVSTVATTPGATRK
jgi:hypothetical protein